MGEKKEGEKKEKGRMDGGTGRTFVNKSFPRPFQKTLMGSFTDYCE